MATVALTKLVSSNSSFSSNCAVTTEVRIVKMADITAEKGSAAAAADVPVADHPDEKLCEGHSARDYRIRQDRRRRRFPHLLQPDHSLHDSGAGDHRPVPGAGLLE